MERQRGMGQTSDMGDYRQAVEETKAIANGLKWYCRVFGSTFSEEEIYKVANSRKGLYAQCNGDVINYILSPKVLGTKLKRKGKETVYPGLIDPLAHYLNRSVIV